MNKSIILCADDFGFNAGISAGIINLVAQQRLSATSCMTNFPAWEKYISELLPYREKIDLGLHFNLITPSLPQIIRVSYLRQLKLELIEAELQTQIENFKNSVGTLPDYIDGHQHIHQLPIIRTALINVIKRNYTTSLPYIRIPSNGLINSLSSAKNLAIHLLGAAALRKLASVNNIPFNSSFAGFSNFDPASDYAAQFEGYLKAIKNQGLIMCHPGLVDQEESNDAIAKSRVNEYNFFNSPRFIELLQQYEVRLTKGTF